MSEDSRIKIEDMMEKVIGSKNDFLIIEDNEDTKKIKFINLIRSMIDDNSKGNNSLLYSSAKITNIVNELKTALSTCAYESDLIELRNILNNITISSTEDGDAAAEIIAARGLYDSLADRIAAERNISDDKYITKPIITIEGSSVYLADHTGTVYIRAENKSSNAVAVVRSRNLVSVDETGYHDINITIDAKNNTEKSIYLNPNLVKNPNTDITHNPGIYFLYMESVIEDFEDYPVVIRIYYNDGTYFDTKYNYTDSIELNPLKAFNKISLLVSNNTSSTKTIQFKNIMFTKNSCPDKYIPYFADTITIDSENKLYEYENNDYIFIGKNCTLNVTGYDNNVDFTSLSASVDNLLDIVSGKLDTCGLLENYGEYRYIEDYEYLTTSTGVTGCNITNDKLITRDGRPSIKLKVDSNATNNPGIIIPVSVNENVCGDMTVTVNFYIGKDVIDSLSDTSGINVYLTSTPIVESRTPTSCYKKLISKLEMVQGWNSYKFRISDCSMIGDFGSTIKNVVLEVGRNGNNNVNGKVFNFHSIVFNQKMTPTVLFSFNTLPTINTNSDMDDLLSTINYMTFKDIPATLFLNSNNSNELTNEQILTRLLELRTKYRWDIGCYGCPNTSSLLNDDNSFEQFRLLKNARTYLSELLINNPIAYSAPYGDMRPITEPLVKDLGYKIAMNGPDDIDHASYCSVFTKSDLSIPRVLINKMTTLDQVKKIVEYTIETGQTVSFYTCGVSEYGSGTCAKRQVFESIIDYLADKTSAGSIQCLSMKDFYKKCVR